MKLIHSLLCALGYHPYIYPAFSDTLRFCPHCNEWDHRVEQIGGGMIWARMRSIDDFQEHAKISSGPPAPPRNQKVKKGMG